MRSPRPAATDPEAPLTAAEFAALLETLGPFEARPTLAVAVSGGPDSMALAILAQDWARARHGQVLALVVDHGLRAEAETEAIQVAGQLAMAGIACWILPWGGAKPATGIQAAARSARYRLLTAACGEAGILHLLLGHQRDDQAETVAIRAARGSGPVGRAGIPAVREVAGLRLLRPLLAVPKSRLVATLRAAGHGWLVDPSNLAPRFIRARLRRDPEFRVEPWWRDGSRQAEARAASDLALAGWLARHVRPHPFGFVRLDRAAWAKLDPQLRPALLGRIVATIGGRAYPMRSALARELASRVTGAAPGARWTGGGCVVAVRQDEVIVTREPGRIRSREPLPPGEELLWDGRFLVTHRGSGRPMEVAALGRLAPQLVPGPCRGRLRAAGVPAMAVAALPAFLSAGRLLACPPLEAYGMAPEPGFLATVAHRPASALTGAAFAGVNVVSKAQRLI